MFFYFSKITQPLLWPLNITLILLTVAALAQWLRRPKLALRLSLGALVTLFAASLPVLAHALLRDLERSYPLVKSSEAPQADVVVVLGTTVWSLESPRLEIEEAGGSRLVPAARLYHAKRAPFVIVASGVPYVDASGAERLEAQDMTDFLAGLGVPSAAVVQEARSRNTDENARYTREILQSRGWKSILLVTSAFHMARSVALFKKYGIETIHPFPTELRVSDRPMRFLDWVPDLASLQMTTGALKEYVGRWVYHLRSSQ